MIGVLGVNPSQFVREIPTPRPNGTIKNNKYNTKQGSINAEK
jgi:hypothetical protein